MPVSIDDLPPAAARAGVALRDNLLSILGDDLVAMWIHGGTTFQDRPRVPGDIDVCAVLARVGANERRRRDWIDVSDSLPRRVQAAEEAVAKEHGFAFDTTYLLRDEIGRPDRGGAFREARRDPGWPVANAHWLTGQYVHLHGARPEELGFLAPTRADLERALDRELEHLERHVYEGDAANPYEATYAVWNGCRILYTLATGSPVISKRSAGAWGLANLPEQWHAPIRAAGRAYDGRATSADNELLRTNMAPFVEMVREHLPPTEERPSGPPRWS